MKKCFFVLALIMAAAFPIANYPQTTSRDRYVRRPSLSLEEALEIGKNYVRREKIDVSEHYLDYVRLNLNPRGDRGKFWEIRWEKNQDGGKGDYIWLFIYMDKQVARIPAK